MENEADVESLMRRIGVDVVYAQDLSFAEQRSLFSGAELIVAPHGSGLANIVWSQPGTRVVELFQADGSGPGDCYARMATSLGLDYDCLQARPSSTAAGVVDLDQLVECLARVDGSISVS